jgi:transcriptional regulator with XRE-family HTH domain
MHDRPLSYWITVARLSFENDFHRVFDDLGISRADLAERLGVTPPYISKVLNGTAGNYQLETMTKWARAIGAILQIRLIKDGEVVRVVDYETAKALEEKEEWNATGEKEEPPSGTSDLYVIDTLATVLPFRIPETPVRITSSSFSALAE